MNTSVVAVNQSLIFADGLIPQDYTEAMSYSLLWSQAVARQANSDPSSKPYTATLTHELATIGWNILAASSTTYEQNAGHFSLAGVLQQMLKPQLDDQQMQQLAGVLKGIQQPQYADFLGFWLRQSQTASVTNMAIGPLFAIQGQPATKRMRYSFQSTDSSWQSFFVASDRTALTVSVDFIEMTLNLKLWNQYKDALEAKLVDSVKNSVRNLELNR
jgi:hypothetical protein